MANNTERHWVEELFPPHFSLTLENIISEQPPDDNEDAAAATRTLSGGPDSVFAKLARHVSPLDVDAVKNVYERVWLMMQVKAEEERKRRGSYLVTAVTNKVEKEIKKVPASEAGTEMDNTEGRKYKNVSTSTEDLASVIHPDIDDSCIWNSEEISVLRSAFQTTKAENSKLRGELQETQKQFAELQQKFNKERKENEAPSKQLKEAKKANQRLSILVKNLKDQVETMIKQNDFLRKQIQEVRTEQKELLKQNHKLQKSMDHERINRKKAELELQCQTREALREQKIHEENLKMMHEEDIQFLQKTIEELTNELEKEKESHERTKRGLDHLRQHFSSLSIHDEGQEADNIVKEDQLKQWTY